MVEESEESVEKIVDIICRNIAKQTNKNIDYDKICLFDSGIFIAYLTPEERDKELKNGDIVKVKDNIYRTNPSI
ncbi:MAG: hypothetical protein PHN89_00470 [Candidatus Pacebacteria bacterium]|nr:hypothetical protein [Candidatus Paceibacterota bacterium]